MPKFRLSENLRLAATVAVAWLMMGWGFALEAAEAAAAHSRIAVSASGATAAVSNFGATLPQIGGVSGYAGSKECRSCHEEQFTSWHRSYHRTMTQLVSTNSVQADFRGVVLTNDGTRFVLSQRYDQFWAHVERVAGVPPGQPWPEPVDVQLGLVTGSHHMQVFWVADETHDCQVGFPFTWLIPERRWVPRNHTFLRPPSFEHRSETWNHVCSRCHATGTQPNLARTTLTWHTEVGELGIACEACHGPGQRHVAARLAERDKAVEPTDGKLRGEIVHPKKVDPVRASQICAFCHSMKWWDRTEGWPERGFRFRPGDDLEATTPIIRPKQVERQPWLKSVLEKNPDLFRDFFWSDGMIRVSGRDYNGLIESPCYAGGQFTCLSCHSLHNSEPDDQLARNRTGNRACTQCHARFAEEAALSAHSHHRPNSSGSECYNCHMPHTTYGVLTAIRSHQISSPKVADEIATGRPNACNLCHLDKSLGWTAAQLGKWFGQKRPELSREQLEVADSVRLALSGDAGQRVLLAWHFGWKPAMEISGTAWLPPVAGQLLDDPYAAVRCVAERSLKQMPTNLLPAGYDFTVAPEARLPLRTRVVEQWSQGKDAASPELLPASTLLRAHDWAATQAALEELIRQRDERPIRLRE